MLGLRLGAADLGLGRGCELWYQGLKIEGLVLGLRLGAVDLGLGRLCELRV